MAESGLDPEVDPEVLQTCLWRELRTEVTGWEDEESDGYDCLTRFWCQRAVFEIYWVAERVSGDDDTVENRVYNVYLTEDLQLESFKCRFTYQPDMQWKRALAVKLGWQPRAKEIIQELSDTQAERFSD